MIVYLETSKGIVLSPLKYKISKGEIYRSKNISSLTFSCRPSYRD